MISKLRSPVSPPPALDVSIKTMATLRTYEFAEVRRRSLELELADLLRRAQDRADADRRRDLVAYDEVLREMGPEIANREARPPIEHRRHVEAAIAKLFADIGYVPDNGRAE